jgi:hypothetical protein
VTHGGGSRQREADRCPYRRPFAQAFDCCPAYVPETFTTVDSRGLPRGTWLTCAHLRSGSHPEQSGHFYPSCALGTAEDRLRFAVEETRVTAPFRLIEGEGPAA